MGSRLGFFYVVVCGFFWWFHLVGLGVGILVSLGLRYRLLWFWDSRWVFPMGLSVGLGLRYRLLWF